MPKPAARLGDSTAHGAPLGGGTGSLNVLIGNRPAWRAIPIAAAPGLSAAKQTSKITLQSLKAARIAASGTPGAPAAIAAEQAGIAAAAASMGAMISGLGGMSDISICPVPLPVPPHGPGVVTNGSPTVLVNNMPLARLGDTIVEALGPPNKIVSGATSVMVK
jgi:uncharacterized Zn-binding protein involved in type VI secretion